MDIDSNHTQRSNRNVQQFDYNVRRHSIPAGIGQQARTHVLPAPQGTKRKMSSDREFLGMGGQSDPQLVGPGVASTTEVDAPVPKRRGSAIDTQRIASLS